MKAFLGIDGGGTKTKFTLCDASGRILAESIQPTSHYLQGGLDHVTQVLSDGLAAVLSQSGESRENITYAFVGCPGFGDTESATPGILAAVGQALAGIPHGVGNDCENSLAGALAGACGISLICGTGSIGCGRNEQGTSLRCGGWHHALGSDEGSGYWISIRMLQAFTRQSDGRAPRTPLYQAIKDALDISEDGGVITRVVDEWGLDRTRIASLSRIIADLFDQGDPYARCILEDAARELSDIAWALYQRLGFTGVIPVSYTGGVFQLGERLLAPLRSNLAARQMELVPPLLPPDCGSLILAFQRSGTPIPKGLLQVR